MLNQAAQEIASTPAGPIEYRLEGSGPVVMVLNGGHCTRDTRLSHEGLSAQGFTVLTPSRPGYDSTPSAVGASAQAAADALAALLAALGIPTADVIGISAAGPTALAFAQRHPDRTRKVVLESAMATDWDERVKRRSRLGFGRAEPLTWGLMHTLLNLFPMLVIQIILRDLTTLNVAEVIGRMSPEDIAFIKRMVRTSRSGTGFLNDIQHSVEQLDTISRPVLCMFSPYDNTVSPRNAVRVGREIAGSELYEVPADTHLLWIGKTAGDVWNRRIAFLRG